MSNKKIKIFIGAYLNSTNAQNLNSLAIANYIDKRKFDVKSLLLYSGNLSKPDILDVKYIKVKKPHRLFKYMSYLLGIFWCDIAYLPKGEIVGWNFFWIKILNKKSFSTVEGILDEKNLESSLTLHKDYDALLNHYKKFDKLYAITKYLKHYNFEHHGIILEEHPLYLGTNVQTFLNPNKTIAQLHDIIYIGRLFERKGVYDFLSIVEQFPNLQFHLVGDGEEKEQILKSIQNKQLKNIKVYGILNHRDLGKLLKTIDLHILPSRSEGFPKVTLETAAAGVPSLVYGDYGANEWITHNQNGFVVDTVEQMKGTVKTLKENPVLLQLNSKNAIALAKQFDWNIVIKQWEKEISKLYNH